MGILETLVIGVGAGIAKGILKVWFKEDPISTGVGNSLLDIVKSKISNTIEQDEVEKQFDQVAKKVAQSIKDIITIRYPHISEDRKVVIANAAGEAVNTTEFSAELLVKANLSPIDLSDLFLKKSGAEGGNPAFSGKGDRLAKPEERDLYSAILSEAAQLIVDGASQYPNFTEAVFSELLQGQDEHVQKIDLILDELRRIREGRTGDNAAYDDFEEKYRRAVIRRLDELQLFGVDLASTSKRYKLSTAYVSLLVEREALQSESVTDAVLKEHEEDTRESVKVEEALAQSSRLFIRGAPGSGKTTLLQWVAVMSSARNLKDVLSEWNDYVPFFVRLRGFADKDLPSPDDFAGLINETLESAPHGWIRFQLQSERGVLLIDGLDELPSDRKDDVRKWLNDLTADFPNARYVLSARPHAAEEGWLEPEGFLDAELQDMNPADIESFITHWHHAAREALKEPEKIKQLNELEEALTQRIQKSTAIYKLATSPLLCAVICALHRDRMQNIPEDRIELYEACIDMFLRRDHERRIALPQYPNLNSRQIKALLSDLAYWYIRNGLSLADAKDIDDRLQKKLADFKNLPEGTDGTAVRTGFVARSGILREPSTGKVDFPHRTFQEFLAAKEIVEERDFGVLIKNADDQPNWRETMILVAGLAPQGDAEGLILNLLTRFDEQSEARLLLLAVGCLELAVAVSKPVKHMVEERVARILPPKSLTEANSLASAGDSVVPLLTEVDRLRSVEAAAATRLLILIGTRGALQELQKIANTDTRVAVWRQLLIGLARTPDPESYKKAIFPQRKTELVIYDLDEGAISLRADMCTQIGSHDVERIIRTGQIPWITIVGPHFKTFVYIGIRRALRAAGYGRVYPGRAPENELWFAPTGPG